MSQKLRELFSRFEEQLQIAASIPGINLDSAMEILAEISPGPQKSFNAPEKLCKWAGLTPRNEESAGKVKSRKTLHGNPYVKSILVQCAWAAVKTRNCEFKEWFWSRQGRLGRKKRSLLWQESCFISSIPCSPEVCPIRRRYRPIKQPEPIPGLSSCHACGMVAFSLFVTVSFSRKTVPGCV